MLPLVTFRIGPGEFKSVRNVAYHRRILFLSVQGYAWTEYEFTCLCVCVRHTLSIRLSPTGQTPQWIFTVDSLKHADLRNDVPLGGLDDD